MTRTIKTVFYCAFIFRLYHVKIKTQRERERGGERETETETQRETEREIFFNSGSLSEVHVGAFKNQEPVPWLPPCVNELSR